MESRRNLESLEENSLLTLDSDILRPFDESSQISLRLDVPSDSKVSGILFEQWTLDFVATLGSC